MELFGVLLLAFFITCILFYVFAVIWGAVISFHAYRHYKKGQVLRKKE